MQGIVISINAPGAFKKLRRAVVVKVTPSINIWLWGFIFGGYSEASDIPWSYNSLYGSATNF